MKKILIYLCDLAVLLGNGHTLGGLRCPLCSRTRLCIPHSDLCIPHSDGPDFIVCPPPTIMPAWGHTIVCQVIACIIIKQPTLCRALGEVYWCCGTQFVHPSWPTSRQNAKLYPANLPPLLFSRLWGKFCESVSMALHMYAHKQRLLDVLS